MKNNKIKVAVIIDTWFPFVGGGQINAFEICKRIARDNIFIDIITRDNGKEDLKFSKNLKLIKLGKKSKPNNSLSKIIFALRSFLFIYKKDYDLVHAHAFLPGITARLLMITKGVPAIFTVHGTSINTKLNNIFSRLIEKFILTQILYSSQITVSRDFLEIKNVNKKIFYIPNGVETQSFDRIKIHKNRLPTLIFVGRLHRQKNLETLINSMKTIKEEIPKIQLLILGDGPEKNELRQLVGKLRLESTIKFLGKITGTNLIRFYKSSHLFVLPSIYEGQPLSLLEAWAAKLPVVTTKTGDCQYLVKNAYNGYLIHDPYDNFEIAGIIRKMFGNKNLGKLGQNGYNLVKIKFDWDRLADETLKIYKSLI